MVFSIGIMVVLVAAIAAVLICFVLLRRHRESAPACGNCSYIVEGLEGLRCPECGSDLRVVGIITPEMTRRLAPRARTTLAVLLFTILYPFVAAPAVTIARRIVASPRWINTTDFDMTSMTPGIPRLVMRGSDSRHVPGEEHLELRFERPDGSLSRAIEVDLPAKTYRIEQVDGVAEGEVAVDETVIGAWFSAERHGSPGGDDPSSDHAFGVLIDDMLDGRVKDPNFAMTSPEGYTSVSVAKMSTRVHQPWFPWAAGGLCVLGWLVGVFLIIRHGKKAAGKRTSGVGERPEALAT